jgi:hypothetical protein
VYTRNILSASRYLSRSKEEYGPEIGFSHKTEKVVEVVEATLGLMFPPSCLLNKWQKDETGV